MKNKYLIAVAVLMLPIIFGGYTYMKSMGAPENLGPPLGSNLPATINLADSEGVMRDFDSLTGTKGAVIVFYRSADWCPFCKLQLIGLNDDSQRKIEKRGYKLAAISYDPTNILADFTDRWSIKYPLLSDEGSKTIDAFGIRNEMVTSGHGAGIPHPIIIITDASGVITAKLHESSYQSRPSVEAILESIDSL